MTGRPSIASQDPVEVAGLELAQRLQRLQVRPARAAASPRLASGAARIMAWTMRRPAFLAEHVLGAAQADALAPSSRARVASSGRVGVGAHAQALGLVRPAEDRRQLAVRGDVGLDGRDPPSEHLARRCRRARSSRLPSAPCRWPTVALRATSISICSAPATHGLPIWRATTAAWLVMPPRDVRMPAARAIPWKSSGDVSRRARMTGSPSLAHCSARSGSKTSLPTAAPGEAARPLPEPLRWPRLGRRVELRHQQLLDLRRLDARERLVLGDQPFLDHLDRGRRPRRARCAWRCASGACTACRARR